MNVTVKNYGDTDISTPFTIAFNITDNGYPEYFNESSKTFPTCIGLTSMKAETSYNVSWNWTAPKPSEMPPGSNNDLTKNDVTFTAWFKTDLAGDPISSNDKKSIEILISRPDFKIDLIPGWWWKEGSSWEYVPQKKVIFTVQAGQVNQFELKFTLVNKKDPTYISYTINTPTDWNAIAPQRRYWNRNDNSSYMEMNLTVMVIPSSNLEYIPCDTDLNIKLNAISEYYPDYIASLNFKVKINFIPNPVVKPPKTPNDDGVLFYQPGFVFLNFTVYNLGNGVDTLEATAEVGLNRYQTNNRLSDGWNAVVHLGKYIQNLNRGEFQNVTVKVTVPSVVPIHSPCPIKLSAISIGDSSHPNAEHNDSVTIYTDEFRDLSFVEPPPEKVTMYPDSEASRVFKIRNTGNTRAKNIAFNISSAPTDWELKFDASEIPTDGLMRNGTAEIEVFIKTPKRVIQAEYDINITLLLDNKPKDELSFPVEILKVHSLGLYCKNPKKNGNITEELSFVLILENLGNSVDSFEMNYENITLAIEDQNWKVRILKSVITLNPYEITKFEVFIPIPLKALADTNFHTPELNGYKFQILGNSQNETTAKDYTELEVLVNPFYDFNLNKYKDKKYLIMYHQGSSEYKFNITNNGNNIDWYDLDYISDYDWMSISYVQRRLEPGVTEQLYVNFESPWKYEAGVYIFLIEVQSAQKADLKQTLELTLIIQKFDIAVTDLRINNESTGRVKLKEHDIVTIQAKLVNIGEINYSKKNMGEEMIVRFWEGTNFIHETNITILRSQVTSDNSTIWVETQWEVGKAKNYILTVELDPYEVIPESIRSNNELERRVTIDVIETRKQENEEEDYNNIYILSIIILVVIVIVSLMLILRSRNLRRLSKSGYTATGEYRPFTEIKKEPSEALKRDYKDFEAEPDKDALGTPATPGKLSEERDKFLSERLSMQTMQPVEEMKPIEMMKPIETSKPILPEKKDE
ncbi:MAG: hypothetical protein ACFFG0_25485 [Candidatus Thorarchaeota archaeon]